MSKLKIILFIFTYILGACSFASQSVVQGPFHFNMQDQSVIEFIKKDDESIDFIVKTSSKNELIDSYLVGDGIPKINTVFFYTIKNIKNIIVLVSWNENNISAIHYKVYLYTCNGNNKISINNDAMSDKNLEGYDGYSNSGVTFNYKDASTIKKYLSQIK